jgi:hypothetical protein
LTANFLFIILYFNLHILLAIYFRYFIIAVINIIVAINTIAINISFRQSTSSDLDNIQGTYIMACTKAKSNFIAFIVEDKAMDRIVIANIKGIVDIKGIMGNV